MRIKIFIKGGQVIDATKSTRADIQEIEIVDFDIDGIDELEIVPVKYGKDYKPAYFYKIPIRYLKPKKRG